MVRKMLAIAASAVLGTTVAVTVAARAQKSVPVNPPVLRPETFGAGRDDARESDLAGWGTDGTSLFRTCQFADPATIAAFIDDLNRTADTLNHHPDLQQQGETLEILTTTHDTGGLTGLDFELARATSQLLAARDVRCVPERLATIVP